MKKTIKLLLVIISSLLLLSCNRTVTEEEARAVLHKHLEERYGEPFRIGNMDILMGRERPYYQATILPSRYVGTPKQWDSYYSAVGTVRINKNRMGEYLGRGGDIYMTVRLNEEANSFFLPKLQELFGEQVLPIIQIDAFAIKENGDFIKSWENSIKENKYFYMEGGIYIFGRIDNLDEKDVYREKIFEFIQYMKSKNMFGRVNLAFYILDERCLTERFDTEIGDNLLRARRELQTADEFLSYRRTQMDLLTEEFSEMDKESINTRINNLNKGNLRDSDKNKDNKFSVIYHTAIRSPSFYDFETRIHHYKKLYYDVLLDLKLYNTMKIIYREYDVEKLHNNEWDGE